MGKGKGNAGGSAAGSGNPNVGQPEVCNVIRKRLICISLDKEKKAKKIKMRMSKQILKPTIM